MHRPHKMPLMLNYTFQQPISIKGLTALNDCYGVKQVFSNKSLTVVNVTSASNL